VSVVPDVLFAVTKNPLVFLKLVRVLSVIVKDTSVSALTFFLSVKAPAAATSPVTLNVALGMALDMVSASQRSRHQMVRFKELGLGLPRGAMGKSESLDLNPLV
jgi:hypothetical protein